MISETTIESVREIAKIEEVVGDFLKLKKQSANLVAQCPFHNEKSPSFTVSPAKQIFKCFGCGKGGNTIDFLIEHEKISFLDAIRWLAKRYNIEVAEERTKDFVKPVQRLEKLNPRIIDWFGNRGISNNTLLRFGITEAREWMPGLDKETTVICFNYYRDGQLVNIKFRANG